MRQITYAAIWTDLTPSEKVYLAEVVGCSVPILALRKIGLSINNVSCLCPKCEVIRKVDSLVKERKLWLKVDSLVKERKLCPNK